jgi:ferredoxin
MVLDEQKQFELSLITPTGSAETAEQLKLRDKIIEDQEKLYQIVNKSILPKVPSDYDSSYQLILNKLKELDIDRFGISPLMKEYLFKNGMIHPHETRAIVFVYPMKYEEMESVPSLESATEVLRAYYETGQRVLKITKFLRDLGYQSTGHHPLGDIDQYHHILFPPHAVNAGLGEKGRTGLFIDHKYGPLVRIGIISTNMPLEFDEPKIKGVNQFCRRCTFCVANCPSQSLPPDRFSLIESDAKYDFKINGDRCIKYFENHNACGRCVFHCILVKPSIKETTKRINRIEHWYNKWIKTGELAKYKPSLIQQ